MKTHLCRNLIVATALAIGPMAARAGDPSPKAPVEVAAPAEAAAAMTMFPIPDYAGSFIDRAALTGDWGGARTSLAENGGVQIEANVYNYYQGVLDGGLSNDWEYSGVAEYIFKFDSNAAGLWPGGFLFARGETYFGEGINANTGGILATNTHYALRLLSDNGTYLPHIYYTQFLSPKTAVMVGKLDTTVGDINAFAHILGHNRFMNLGFNLNPLLLQGVPYSPLGAGILLLPTENLMVKFIALDTEGAINRSGFDTVFEQGTTYLGEAMVTTNFFNRPGHQTIIGLYSDQEADAAQQDPRLFLPAGAAESNRVSESWAITWNFDQYIVADPNRPGHGWGIFGRAGVSDGKANLLENFYSIGLGGTVRDNDRFGVGYYYLNLASGHSEILLGDNEQGVEVFYNLAPAPWCDFTVNLQMIDGAVNGVDDATVLGFRGTVRF